MRPIDPIYWESIQENGRNDGRRFELLVRSLLEAEGKNWSKQKITWDGGRDFVDFSIPGEERWAECKMYSAPIGYRVLSPTLVMAFINPVKEIIFFSYSRINKQAIDHLGKLSVERGILIKIYDEEALDRLILRNHDVLREFFPPELSKVACSVEPVTGWVKILSDYQYGQVVMERPRKSIEVPIPQYAPLILDLTIRNSSVDEDIYCVIELGDFLTSLPLTVTDPIPGMKQDRFVLSKASIAGRRYLLRAKNHGKACCPNLILNYYAMGRKNQLEIGVDPHIINVSMLREPPLIGAAFKKNIDAIIFECCTSSMVTVAGISGASGVGKSRFLHELGCRLRANNFDVSRLAKGCFGDTNSRGFILSALAKIIGIPDPRTILDQAYIKPRSFVAQQYVDDYNDLCGFLYGGHAAFDDHQFVKKSAKYISTFLVNTRHIVLVDDTQAFDRLEIKFLKEIVNLLAGQCGYSSCLFCFNTELLDGNEEASTLRLIILDQRPATRCGEYTIPEFHEGQVAEFMDEVIFIDEKRSFSQLYPHVVRRIIDELGCRPLSLWQLVQSWREREGITISNGVFIVTSFDTFQECIEQEIRNLDTVLNKRASLLRKNKKGWCLIELLAIIGPFHVVDLPDFGISVHEVNRLADCAVIRVTPDDQIEFYHGIISRFFSDKVAKTSALFNKNIGRHWHGGLRKKWLHQNPVAAYNLDFYLGREATIEMPLLESLSCTKTITHQTGMSAKNILTLFYNDWPPARRLKHIIDLTCHVAFGAPNASLFSGRIRGRSRQTSLLLKYMSDKSMSEYIPKDEHAAILLASAVHKTASQAMSDGFREQATLLLNNWRKTVSSTNKSQWDERCRRIIYATVLGRLCVLYKDLGLYDNALASGKEALATLAMEEYPGVGFLAHIDMGYIYYGDYASREELSMHWNSALCIYRQYERKIREAALDMHLAKGLIEGLYASVQGDIATGIRMLENLISTAREDGQVYYQLQGMVMERVLRLQSALEYEQPLSNAIGSQEMACWEHLYDLVVSMGIERFHIPVMYGRAIVLINTKWTSGSSERILGARKILGTIFLSESWARGGKDTPLKKAVLYDLIATYKILGDVIPVNVEKAASIMLENFGTYKPDNKPRITLFGSSRIDLPYA